MHKLSMADGSKDRPPTAWYLREVIHNGNHIFYEAEGRPAVQQHTAIETVLNMTPENKEHFQSERKHCLLLTGIGDEIYSNVDACNKQMNLWVAMGRLQQGDSDPEQAQKGQGNAKVFGNPCKIPHQGITMTISQGSLESRTMTIAGARETAKCSQDETRCVLCKAEQLISYRGHWYERIDEQELEAHYSYMAKIQEVSPEESSSTGQPLEQVDQNAAECVDERDALANLIANLILDTEENKTILKQLKKANASLTQELEKCKTNLDETNSAFGGGLHLL
ncbi:hypothetical protein Tco_1211678 [Tanacetum coccineum]